MAAASASTTRFEPTMIARACFLVAALCAFAHDAGAQKWTDIGKTSSGNAVSVDLKSVKRTGNLVSATVRVVFTPPVKAARGTWASSKVMASFDCTKRYIAAKENAY